jgi:hypothetical protein
MPPWSWTFSYRPRALVRILSATSN